MKYNLPNFPFTESIFGVLSKKSTPNPRPSKFSVVFLEFYSFVLHLSLYPFEVNFYDACKVCLDLCSACECPHVPEQFVENIFPNELPLHL